MMIYAMPARQYSDSNRRKRKRVDAIERVVVPMDVYESIHRKCCDKHNKGTPENSVLWNAMFNRELRAYKIEAYRRAHG